MIGSQLLFTKKWPPGAIQRCVHDPEVVLRVNYVLNEGTLLQVAGRYDALMLNPDKGKAIIIEFKGRKAWAPDEDFLQVALYAWLFRHKTGIFPNACVIYLEEDDPEIFYDAKILSDH